MPPRGSTEKLDRVVAELKARIAAGRYAPGEFLPSERKLATELRVARNTVRAALSILEHEETIRLDGGRGARVRETLDSGVEGTILLIQSHGAAAGVSVLSPEGMALLAGVLSACSGSDIRFHMQGIPEAGARGLLRLIRGGRFPGVLLVECHQPEVLDALRKESIPHVVVNQEHDLPGPATRVDFWRIGRKAAAYLLRLRHRRLGMISGPKDAFYYERMVAGFRGRLAEEEVFLQAQHIARVRSCSEESRAATLKILSSPKRPTALFCPRDVRAYGAYLAARELGLNVPRDLSLVGYDDITWPGEGRRFLTTFPEPTRELGGAAIHMLTSWIRTGKTPDDVIIAPELIVRKSAAVCGRTGKEDRDGCDENG